jgi:glycosyltransferase involved in cell wall biosynthesis
MRILFLTQYFPPETGAAQNRISYFAKHFAAVGHAVTVLTALPSYPEGKIFAAYRKHWVLEERSEGVRVLRVWIYATKSRAFLRRLMNYFSFVLSSVLLGIGRSGEQDIIIVESPPLFLGLSGLFFKFFKKAKLVFNVSDLWPASAVAMGIVRNRLAIQASKVLEEFIYRNSDLITGQTRGIVQNIQSRMPGKPVALITNGMEVRALPRHTASLAEKRRTFGWQESFLVGYAGIHGLAQGLETILEAAEILRSHRDITFVLFGDGPDKDKLLALAGQRGLTNLKFYPPQPREKILEIIRCFDVALVPLRGLELYRGALPSKLFEAMGCGVPLVASVAGEAQALVNQAGGGICVPPENAQAIAEAILRFYQDPSLRSRMGARGRRYVTENYNRFDIARNYEQLLEKISEPNADWSGFTRVREAKSRTEYPQAY